MNTKKFTFTFTGRQSGAIGITYKISDSYEAKDIHEAMSLLYEDYEMIRGLSIKNGGKSIEQPEKIEWVKVRSHRTRSRKGDNASYA